MTALIARFNRWVQAASPAVDLGLRLYLAEIFFRSGLLKITNWSATLYLFREEYRVPVLRPEFAAWLGTFCELFFPLLLALGVATRLTALSLSLFNVMAVISFWHVLSENEAARTSHLYWGLLLLVTLCHGPGKLSVDHWIAMRMASADINVAPSLKR